MINFIKNISIKNGIPDGLSIEDLYAYSQNLLFDYCECPADSKVLKNTEYLARKIIEIENNERSYTNYFSILKHSGQHKKEIMQYKKLIDSGLFEDFALQSLSYVMYKNKIILNKDNYKEVLKSRLLVTSDQREKEDILILLKAKRKKSN